MSEHKLLAQSVDHAADRYPDTVAFVYQSETLNYAEVAQAATRLANALVAQGVERGDRVGIFCNKSLHSAVAIYGILKAGAAYVPIDPQAPVIRIREILAKCGVRHIVSHAAKRREVDDLLAADDRLDAVIGLAPPEMPYNGTCRFMDWQAVDGLDGERAPALSLTETDLAYVMFTSGSTGTPKGIMHSNYSGLSYARLSADTYGLRHGDRLGNHSPLHFDMSTLEYLTGPLAGCTTVIIPEAYTKLPASLSQLIEQERLTIWYSVPFALIQLLLRGVLEDRDLSSLRWVLFGGEPFPPKYIRALMDLLPRARFSNVYGPAETNQCMYYHVPTSLTGLEESIPIGTLWDAAESLIVDEQDQPVPLGTTGELLVRSATMMGGYWNEPELNRKCFFQRGTDTAGAGECFYRTGDLVSMDAAQVYSYHGRKDRQIKVRGNRIELDEIESVFQAHDEVEEAAAYATGSDHGSDHDPAQSSTVSCAGIDVAVILAPGSGLSDKALREHAAERLPRYAWPENIRFLSGFPRTSSGKIDRKKLKQGFLSEHLSPPSRASG